VNALANDEVGRYVERHFVAAFQRVATFQINGTQKNGGNVATYFCTPDGFVLHAIAGPVDADVFLREARWVRDTYHLALLAQEKTPVQLRLSFRKAHHERLHKEHAVRKSLQQLRPLVDYSPRSLEQVLRQHHHAALSNQGKIHVLLAVAPLPRIDQVYLTVFERILNEKISTQPVQVAGR
jgi:hypothetical protein